MRSELAERIIRFNQGRLPEMTQLKYEAMTENAFRFFRGTCHLFYEDLQKKSLPESPQTWICGDLHLENFGSYKADNKLVYFDLNDFDEALLAPCLLELLRIVTSIFIAFRSLDIEDNKAENMAVLFVKNYASALCKGKSVSIDPRTAKGIVCSFLKKAHHSSYGDIMKKRTEKKRNYRKLSLKDERHFKIEKELKKQLTAHINEWIKKSSDGPYNYEVIDSVFRLAGTGSVGSKRYLFLLKSTLIKDNYLLVDMKQAFPSSLNPFVNVVQPVWDNEAARILAVQQRMQCVSASLLSSTFFNEEPYVIQELQPVKDTIKFKLIKDRYRDIIQVIDDMALLTASSQIRSSGMNGSGITDELIAFGSRKDWQEFVVNYAKEYAEQVSRDFKQFRKDYRNNVFKPS